MIRTVAHKLLNPQQRRMIRRWLDRLGFEHRFLRLRRSGYRLLSGCGVEIGAFEHPAPVPPRCTVRYLDVLTPKQAKEIFPEIDETKLVPIDLLVDLDRSGLAEIPSATQQFVIACHVIEHVANPGRLVAEMVRVLRPGGHLVIAAPDRDYTFDRNRPLTPLATLQTYYEQGRPQITPEDYRDVLTYVHPAIAEQSEPARAAFLANAHQRREHLSVWTSDTFREFLLAAFNWCGAKMAPEYEVGSTRNRFEYFGVWRKL